MGTRTACSPWTWLRFVRTALHRCAPLPACLTPGCHAVLDCAPYQVHEVLRQLCPAVGLTSGVAAAQQTLGAEAQSIMGRPISLGCAEATLNSSSSSTTMDAGHLQQQQEVDCACVDILVATPGRLMAHLQHTPGFSLRHLRYLVRAVCWPE